MIDCNATETKFQRLSSFGRQEQSAPDPATVRIVYKPDEASDGGMGVLVKTDELCRHGFRT